MVKYRMPYDKHVEEHPHMASFVASVNGNDFLTDPTGSRRFLPFEVLSIDINRARSVSMDAVYAEAKRLLQSGYRYWFNDEEIAELYRESEAFQVQTAEMELLLRCFELPTTDSDCSCLTTTEILKRHPSFKVDTEKNLWIDYSEVRGGSTGQPCQIGNKSKCRCF